MQPSAKVAHLFRTGRLAHAARTLALVHAIATRGVGSDTTPEQALDTIANLIANRGARSLEDSGWFVPEGDRTCGVVHRLARATCMKRRGHEGSHATPQGTWIDGPWCEYPETLP